MNEEKYFIQNIKKLLLPENKAKGECLLEENDMHQTSKHVNFISDNRLKHVYTASWTQNIKKKN